jgi:hypothetical protein
MFDMVCSRLQSGQPVFSGTRRALFAMAVCGFIAVPVVSRSADANGVSRDRDCVGFG